MSVVTLTVNRSGHIVELQSLRGIAASAVLFGHVIGYYVIPDWLVNIGLLSNGRAAVVIFFVLSGYVLTRSLRSSAFDLQAAIDHRLNRFWDLRLALCAGRSARCAGTSRWPAPDIAQSACHLEADQVALLRREGGFGLAWHAPT